MRVSGENPRRRQRSVPQIMSKSLPKPPSSAQRRASTHRPQLHSAPVPCSEARSSTQMPSLEERLDETLASMLSGGTSIGSAGSSGNHMNTVAFVMFAPDRSSSRADAIALDRWVSKSFQQFVQTSGSLGVEGTVEQLVPILSTGLHEVIRQVAFHCFERAIVLEKVWRTYVELFERALSEARHAERRHRQHEHKIQSAIERTKCDIEELKLKHPAQLQKLSETLAGKFRQRIGELDEHLVLLRRENAALVAGMSEQSSDVNAWFPRFHRYKDTKIRNDLAVASPLSPTTLAPESAIAADFKRILTALPPDRRRRVGFFVSSLLGLRFQAGSDSVEELTERRDHNQRVLADLEAKVSALRGC